MPKTKKNSYARQFNIIIEILNKEEELNKNISATELVDRFIYYTKQIFKLGIAYNILHWKDTKENGEAKRPHMHCVLNLKGRMTKQSLINKLCELLNIEENRISVESVNNLRSCLRYLIHLDDIDKTKYDYEDILTNDEETLKRAIFYNENLSVEELQELCKNMSLVEIIKLLGVEAYKKYRIVILDLIHFEEVEVGE